jgi:hypothetical protein
LSHAGLDCAVFSQKESLQVRVTRSALSLASQALNLGPKAEQLDSLSDQLQRAGLLDRGL